MVRVISTAYLRGVDYGGDNLADGWAYELDEPPEDQLQEPVLQMHGHSTRRRVRAKPIKPSPPAKPAERIAVGKQAAQTKFAWEK